MAGWAQAKERMDAAEGLAREAREFSRQAAQLRAEAGYLRSAQVRRVDTVIGAQAPAAETGEGVGLVAAGRPDQLLELQDALSRRLREVWRAPDPAVAVGLAITMQPDLALIVDTDLPIIGGLETARMIRLYAPRAGLLLLTGDAGVERMAHDSGIQTADPSLSPGELLATVDRLVA